VETKAERSDGSGATAEAALGTTSGEAQPEAASLGDAVAAVPDNRRRDRRAAEAHAIAWVTVALTSAVGLGVRPILELRWKTRAFATFFESAQFVAIGLVAAAIVAAWRRFAGFAKGRPRVSYAAAALAFAALGCAVLRDDVSGPAEYFAAHVPLTICIFALSALLGLLVPLAALFGAYLARPWAGPEGGLWAAAARVAPWFGVSGGLALTVANVTMLPEGYPGLHLLAVTIAAVAIASSLDGTGAIARLDRVPRSARFAVTGIAAVVAATSLVVWPESSVVLAMLSEPTAVLVPFLAALKKEDAWSAPVPDAQRAWFSDRSQLPDVAPTLPSLLDPNPTVILLSIDSMRAELLTDEKYRGRFPALFRLRDESTFFTDARSPGSSTGPALSAVFASAYYSQLYWKTGARNDALVYPDADTTPRFPEVLAKHGVRTITFDGSGWLTNGFGIARGFVEEQNLRVRKYAPAKALIDAAIARLAQPDASPSFLFMHFLDAHAPYTSAGAKDTPFDGYVAELGLVDAEIARLRQALEATHRFERSTIVVMADHGEGFGEHGLWFHAASLYDELLRVPLLVHVPHARPRNVSDRVSLVDVGPTILDLMGVPTPSRYMGQSLAPFLRGGRPILTRPIVAEARLKRAMVLPDGFKVIHDPRAHTAEIYDLSHDAAESENLFGGGAAPGDERLGVLDTFFRAQTLKRAGYEVPYRKW
jgi:hypothetical protein